MSKIKIIIASTFCCLALSQCTNDPRAVDIVNPNDSTNTAFIPPLTAIINAPNNGDTIRSSNIIVVWTGTRDVKAYSYKIDDEPWSTFSSDTILHVEDLDEGLHTIKVRSRHANGNIEANPISRTFIIDAVKGPAIMFERRKIVVNKGVQFTYGISIEEMPSMIGIKTHLLFDPAILQIVSIGVGPHAYSQSTTPILFDSVNNISGIAIIDLLLAGGVPTKGIKGTGKTIVLTMNSKSPGNTIIEHFRPETSIRDSNNNAISINELVVGKISVQ